jgi:pimeloyl-ACP methyl ester carboxylesterase
MDPETRYAKTSDGVHIAYQVVGSGPIDLVFVPGFAFPLEGVWDGWSIPAAFLRRLASFSRLIVFNRRGTGLSDRLIPGGEQSLEVRMDDIRAVMDEARSQRAALFGVREGFGLCAMYAATYPERTTALVAFAGVAVGRDVPDFPGGDDEWDSFLAEIERGWGTIEFARQECALVWPDVADPGWPRAYASWMRESASPGDAEALLRTDSYTDVRDLLPTIGVPTLLLHRTQDQTLTVAHARAIAERVPGAKLVELRGRNHSWFSPDQDDILDEVEGFIRQLREEEAEFDRVLATVLFTDIVGSTERAAAVGDRAWRELLDRHHAAVRAMLARYRGREVDTAGDGFFATFDGPARAVRCALAIVEAVRAIGLEIRAGVHTGEIETTSDQSVRGMAVVIGARVGAIAGTGEVLASSTVKDLTAGSGLVFEDRGTHAFKGVPDEWHVFAVVR